MSKYLSFAAISYLLGMANLSAQAVAEPEVEKQTQEKVELPKEAPDATAIELEPAQVELVEPKKDATEESIGEPEIAKEPVTPEVEEPAAPIEKEEQVMGWKEWVWVVNPKIILRAKLDTGAKTCSIHATNIEKIELDGKKWIKFTISDPANAKGARIRHKAPLLRIAKIKNDRGGLDERYVVPLTFQIGDRKMEGEFNLNDRDKMACAMLIGRNLLTDLGYVDSGRTYLLKKPKAPKKKASAAEAK